ncbi:MAG: aldo/keto reductase [Bacteroidota bacterium]|nr:aldo/keto reductase [Bacteroidota bacterium]
MQYKILGKSTLNISRIGFGCMSLKPGQPDFENLINVAIDKGINYFDTADLYDKGLNEVNLGKALKGKRDQVIIATKTGNQWRADGSGWDWNPRKTYILKSVEESLKRLQIDCIDLYQSHGGTIEDNIDETIEAYEILVQQGKIRYYGLSSIRPNVISEFVKKSNIVSVMMQYSLFDRRPEESCLPLLMENNIGVLARGSVAGGLLINKPAKPYLNYDETEVAGAAKAIKTVSGLQRDPAQTAIQFVLKHPAITSAIVGIRTMDQLEDATEAIKNSGLNSEEIKILRESVSVNYYQQHR